MAWTASPAVIGPICSKVALGGPGSVTRSEKDREQVEQPEDDPDRDAASRTAVATPRLSRATSARYSTEPVAARSVGPRLRDRTGISVGRREPVRGQDHPPRETLPSTATAPAVSTSAPSMAALAARTVGRRGIAVSVTWIMRVLYSLGDRRTRGSR